MVKFSTDDKSTSLISNDYHTTASAEFEQESLPHASDHSSSDCSYSSDTNMHPRDRSSVRTNGSVLKKPFILMISGIILGMFMPKNEDLPTPYYRYISSVLGYTYFLCWSISFYPQIILNHRNKSTFGLSSDFTILNVVGFLCYSFYNACLFWVDSVKEQYRQRNGEISTVQSNDVAFAFHALLLSSITMAQVLYFRTYSNNFTTNSMNVRERSSSGTNVMTLFSPLTKYFLLLAILVSVPFAILVYREAYNLQFLDFLYLLSSIKLTITIIKYIPQVLLNYNRKSTEGWNVWNVLLDFSGGMLSLLQLVLDCVDLGDWTGITGNWAKFGLSFVSITFDIVFMLQHVVLYPIHNVSSDRSSSSTSTNRRPEEELLV